MEEDTAIINQEERLEQLVLLCTKLRVLCNVIQQSREYIFSYNDKVGPFVYMLV